MIFTFQKVWPPKDAGQQLIQKKVYLIFARSKLTVIPGR